MYLTAIVLMVLALALFIAGLQQDDRGALNMAAVAALLSLGAFLWDKVTKGNGRDS